MKVDPAKPGRGRPARAGRGAPPRLNAGPSGFVEALNDAVSGRGERMTEADLETVDRCAAALRRSPTLENLRAYREAIRSFLARLLAAYSVEEIRGFNRFGKRSITVLVRVVDAELDELARMVLQRSQETLAIAAKLDDIRGILLDYIR